MLDELLVKIQFHVIERDASSRNGIEVERALRGTEGEIEREWRLLPVGRGLIGVGKPLTYTRSISPISSPESRHRVAFLPPC